MAKDFYTRLRDYFAKVAEVLRGEAEAASVFPNPSDKGMVREKLYVDFLRRHAPSKCNVSLGGFLFDLTGTESKQIDIIVTTDTAPRFDFHNPDGSGKSFSPVEGTIAAASIKSKLDKKELFDALEGIASIPNVDDLGARLSPLVSIKNYNDWPLKIIYASDGLNPETIIGHIDAFYDENFHIPIWRRPDIIHVIGKYLIVRSSAGSAVEINRITGSVNEIPEGEFRYFVLEPDLHALIWVVQQIQKRLILSNHIFYNFGDILNRLNERT